MFGRRVLIQMALLSALPGMTSIFAAGDAPGLAIVKNSELQPLVAQVRRVIEATDYLGTPLSVVDKQALETAFNQTDADEAGEAIQRVLDKYCLFGVDINPESRVKVAAGPAKPELVEKGWRQFLVKVHNEAGVTAELRAVSRNAQSVHNSPWKKNISDDQYRARGEGSAAESAAELWLDLQMFNVQPLQPVLSGLPLEYRIIQLYSRDAGKREGKIAFNVGQGTQDVGYRNEVDLL